MLKFALTIVLFLCSSVFADDADTRVKGWVDAAIKAASAPRLHKDSGMWAVSHGVLALGKNFEMLPLEPGRKPLDGFHWLTMSGKYKGLMAFEAIPSGVRGRPYDGEDGAFEGHSDQFLAYLTPLNLPLDHRIFATSRYATIGELVENAKKQAGISPLEGYEYEPMYTLWALAHYLPSDARWKNARGEEWSIERLVQATFDDTESTQGKACEGTHHLEALVVALEKWQKRGEPLRGAWSQAQYRIRQNIEIARANQNSDGSFSTRYFWAGGHSTDIGTRLPGNGHTLEFLMMALPDDRLNEPWVKNGVASVAQDLYNHRKEGLNAGSLYHALHALILYRDRTKR